MMRMMNRILHFVVLTMAFALNAPVAFSADVPSLSLPLKCKLGVDCWIQNLVDFDAGPGWRDPFCGTASFNKHKGTDFRVRSIPDLKKNVPVYAMVAGKVVGLRNSMEDNLVEGDKDIAAIKGKECGNGVMVEVGKGWTTQYCHMAKGSVSVKKGDTIKRGDVLGMVGLSGHTTFPHIHVTIRKGKKVIDPMTGLAQNAGCSVQKGLNEKSLWDTSVRKQITGEPSALIATGFTSARVKSSQVLKGEVPKAEQKGPLIFYANFINLKKGDRVALIINGPDGTFVESKGKPLAGPKAVWTAFSGKRGGVPSGTYSGITKLIRDGEVVTESEAVEISF